jgi:voltage-gated potassium channel
MGRYVVSAFRERSVSFVVVEDDLETCQELEEQGIPYIHGDASQPEILEAARVAEAATIIVCVATDALTVYTVLLAKQLNPEITVIARAVEDDAERRLELAGADRVINPYRVGGMRLAFTAIKPTVMDFIEGSIPGVGGGLELAEVTVRRGSPLVGRSIVGADIRRRLEIIVIGLIREGHSSYNPNPETVIEAGDVLVVLGAPSAVEKVMEACAGNG